MEARWVRNVFKGLLEAFHGLFIFCNQKWYPKQARKGVQKGTRKFGIFGPFSHVPKNRVPRGRLGLPKGSRSMFLELPGVQIWLLSPRLCSKSPSLSHSVSSVRPTSSRPCLPQARAATCLMLPPSQACLSWQGFMDLFPVGVPSPRPCPIDVANSIMDLSSSAKPVRHRRFPFEPELRALSS